MIKQITINVDFPDDFTPPEEFDEPTRANKYNSKCQPCPFYSFNDEYAYGECYCVDYENEKCPIKKYFK